MDHLKDGTPVVDIQAHHDENAAYRQRFPDSSTSPPSQPSIVQSPLSSGSTQAAAAAVHGHGGHGHGLDAASPPNTSENGLGLGDINATQAPVIPPVHHVPAQLERPGIERRMSSGLSSGMASLGMGSADPSIPAKDDIVPVGFDEGVLRALCDMDCGMPLLVDRIKQSIGSCKQVAAFFKSRADIEEKYARSLIELNRSTADTYSRMDAKAGSFVHAYHSSLRLQNSLAENRLRFSQRLSEMSEELLSLAREADKQRKLHKENGTRYQQHVQESETAMEKAKVRFDSTAEELERVLVHKEGESMKDSGMRTGEGGGGKRALGKAMTKGLFKGKGAGSMAKQEDDVRARMATASDTFRKAVLESQSLRQEYFNFQLPKILRLLKETADELDLGTQYHLTRFAFLYENTLVNDGTTLNPIGSPDESPSLRGIFEAIDSRSDFKSYMQNYVVARGTPRTPRRDGPYEDGFVPRLPPHVERSQTEQSVQSAQSAQSNGSGAAAIGGEYAIPGIPASSGATFGVDLGEQLARDGTEVPKVVEKCAKAIEAYGLDSMGIYRLSGTTSRVQALKSALDKNIDGTDVSSEEWSADINVVSGALKLWFRELPEPLLTYGLYHQFIEAARYDNDRLRHIRLHEQVNELPDPNYATLKFFMGHLDRVRRQEGVNQMSASNLSIVFGPTLLGAPPEEGGLNLEHMQFQCKAIETILNKYQEIFVEDEGDASQAQSASVETAPAVGSTEQQQQPQPQPQQQPQQQQQQALASESHESERLSVGQGHSGGASPNMASPLLAGLSGQGQVGQVGQAGPTGQAGQPGLV